MSVLQISYLLVLFDVKSTRNNKKKNAALTPFKQGGCANPDRLCCRWKLDGMEIDLDAGGSHYSLVGGNLVISKPDKTEHVGQYSCLATNTYGTAVSREASVQFGCKLSIYSLMCKASPIFNSAALLYFHAYYAN